MGHTLFTIRLAEMLLIPVDSQTLGRLYEKAPKKKLPSIARKIPDRIRMKTIANLLDRWNLTYTITQISEGRLDRFYHYVADDKTNASSYTELQQLLKNHDMRAGNTFLTLIKRQDNKALEDFFENEISNVTELHDDWDKIDWSTNEERADSQKNISEHQLASDMAKMIKANAKLKEKLDQAGAEILRLNQAHKIEIDSMTDNFQEQLKQQKQSEDENRFQALAEIREKDIKEKKNIISKNKNEIDSLTTSVNDIKIRLSQESSRANRYRTILKEIIDKQSDELIIVAYEPILLSPPAEYVFVGAPESVEQLAELVRLLKPSKLILIQEITPRNEWLTLMTKIREDGFSTKVVINSKYELTEGRK